MKNNSDIRNVIDGILGLVPIITSYYLELIKCGIDTDHALELTKSFQTDIINLNKSTPPNETP